jgi:uncharacterized protein YihD (DUF1040 family)
MLIDSMRYVASVACLETVLCELTEDVLIGIYHLQI